MRQPGADSSSTSAARIIAIASLGRPRQGQKNWSRVPERRRDLRGTAAGGSAPIDTIVVLYPLQNLPHVPFRKRPQCLLPDVSQGTSRQQQAGCSGVVGGIDDRDGIVPAQA